MSEDLQQKVDTLNLENANLKKQLEVNQAGIDGLLSQLDAHREQLNESLNSGLTMRTNVLFLKKQNQKLTNQLDSANKRIAELELPK